MQSNVYEYDGGGKMTKIEMLLVSIFISNAIWFWWVYKKLEDAVRWRISTIVWRVEQAEKKIVDEMRREDETT